MNSNFSVIKCVFLCILSFNYGYTHIKERNSIRLTNAIEMKKSNKNFHLQEIKNEEKIRNDLARF